jgi:hypothetical protein
MFAALLACNVIMARSFYNAMSAQRQLSHSLRLI